MVIARKGGDDIPYLTIGRPILDLVRTTGGKVSLDVLRPPTFSKLLEHLASRRNFYHVFHFDGHGSFLTGGPINQDTFAVEADSGHVLFETDNDKTELVSSKELGQALVNSGIKLCVLNACQSSYEGIIDAYSSVASQLILNGADAVVAMSQSVHKDAAEIFVKSLYEGLLQGLPIETCMRNTRTKLMQDPFRESSAGQIPLSDWIVPRLYKAADASLSWDFLRVETKTQCEITPPGRYGFVGRDNDTLAMEKLVKESPAGIVITGGLGVGKTEFAGQFASWLNETNGHKTSIISIVYDNDFKAALRWMKKSIRQRKIRKLHHMLKAPVHHIAMIKTARGDLPSAIIFYRKSIALEKKYGDSINLARAFHDLSIAYQSAGFDDNAKVLQDLP